MTLALDGETLLAEITTFDERVHSERLLPAVDQLLRVADLSLDEIEAFDEERANRLVVAGGKLVLVGGRDEQGRDVTNDHACVDEVGDGIGRVDEQAFARRAVADRVDEVDHLLSEHVAGGEVAPGQQLSEVETIVVHPLQCAKPPYASSHG